MRLNPTRGARKEIMIYVLDYADDVHIVFHDLGEGTQSKAKQENTPAARSSAGDTVRWQDEM
jgi:hypothetical protein